MLLAERRVRTQKRTDGGDGKVVGAQKTQVLFVDRNDPLEDTPCRWWNMAVPVLALVGYIFALLVKSGDDGSGTQTFVDKIENSDSYVALLWGTMAAALTAFAFYVLQDKKDGHILWFNFRGHYHRFLRWMNSFSCFGSKNEDHIKEIVEQPKKAKKVGFDGEGEEEEDDEPAEAVVESHSQPLITWHEALGAFLIGMERIFPA